MSDQEKRINTKEEDIAMHTEHMRLNAIRNKDWKDANDNERLEKLKMAIEELPNWGYQIAELQQFNRRMKNHSHAQDGKVMIALDTIENNSNGMSATLGRRNPLA